MSMSDIARIVIFSLATIGLTNMIVDPAAIMKPLRDLIDRRGHPWLSKLVSCYQCSGTWVGFLCGYLIVGREPETVFACGMAGSYLATMSATYTNYLEARSIIGVEENAE
jgi:hypothetical protein